MELVTISFAGAKSWEVIMKIETEICSFQKTCVQFEHDYVKGEYIPIMNLGIMDSGIKPNNLSTKSYFPFSNLPLIKKISPEKF